MRTLFPYTAVVVVFALRSFPLANGCKIYDIDRIRPSELGDSSSLNMVKEEPIMFYNSDNRNTPSRELNLQVIAKQTSTVPEGNSDFTIIVSTWGNEATDEFIVSFEYDAHHIDSFSQLGKNIFLKGNMSCHLPIQGKTLRIFTARKLIKAF